MDHVDLAVADEDVPAAISQPAAQQQRGFCQELLDNSSPVLATAVLLHDSPTEPEKHAACSRLVGSRSNGTARVQPKKNFSDNPSSSSSAAALDSPTSSSQACLTLPT